jgi:hypothetical protein
MAFDSEFRERFVQALKDKREKVNQFRAEAEERRRESRERLPEKPRFEHVSFDPPL